MGFWESNGPERKSRTPTQQWALKTSITQWVRDNSVSKQITSKFHLMSGKHKCIVGAASNAVPTWSPFSFRALCASAHVTVSAPASPSSCLTLFGKGFQRWQNVLLEVDWCMGKYVNAYDLLWSSMTTAFQPDIWPNWAQKGLAEWIQQRAGNPQSPEGFSRSF